ncbi:Chitinase-like protein [Actinidia chinensis var. chinensis]|uniref:Chitinase-like protein n=1 Tax=Actinidia chinensis var. chinensis TaxID=1590841 RepID=A0A2R6S0A0_ACTCC|nr:Chitinase-like protein [Actinidia chinensis var. chinensis]
MGSRKREKRSKSSSGRTNTNTKKTKSRTPLGPNRPKKNKTNANANANDNAKTKSKKGKFENSRSNESKNNRSGIFVAETAADQLRFFLDQYQSANGVQLSSLELESINDKCILELSQGLDQSTSNLGDHVKAAFGSSWKEILCEKQLLEGKIDPGNPALLVISLSALRSLELLRGLRALTGECPAAKLFSKHMKIEVQNIFCFDGFASSNRRMPCRKAHDVFVGNWKPTKNDTLAKRTPGFGTTMNGLYGDQVCGKGDVDGMNSIVSHFLYYLDLLGVGREEAGPHEVLTCAKQKPFNSAPTTTSS